MNLCQEKKIVRRAGKLNDHVRKIAAEMLSRLKAVEKQAAPHAGAGKPRFGGTLACRKRLTGKAGKIHVYFLMNWFILILSESRLGRRSGRCVVGKGCFSRRALR